MLPVYLIHLIFGELLQWQGIHLSKTRTGQLLKDQLADPLTYFYDSWEDKRCQFAIFSFEVPKSQGIILPRCSKHT